MTARALVPAQAQDIMLNHRPAPYRRDLKGVDLLFELGLMFAEFVQPGDVVSIPNWVICDLPLGPAMTFTLTPPWPAKSWWCPADNCLKIERLR